jgi:hypothetical protein
MLVSEAGGHWKLFQGLQTLRIRQIAIQVDTNFGYKIPRFFIPKIGDKQPVPLVLFKYQMLPEDG